MKYFQSYDAQVNENVFATVNPTAEAKPTQPADNKTATTTNAGTPATPAAKPEEKPASTQGLGTMSLQEQLKQWIQKYSQAFKFINDKPFTTEVSKDVKGQSAMLGNTIVNENRQLVKEGIGNVVEILANPKFKGVNVQIIGHTSTPGPKGREKEYNQSLSERRAHIVHNAIMETALESKKDLSQIKFSIIGKGLTDPIILNDQTVDPLKIKQMDGKFDEATLASLSESKEARQKINRRVIITLPNYKEPVPQVKAQVPVKAETAPDRINTLGITFNPDSYFLSERGKRVLNEVATHVASRANGSYRVKNIYISAHTETLKGGDKREEMMYILSLNRAYSVKKYLQSKIKEKVNYVMYGCGSQLPLSKGDINGFDDEKRVQLTFDDELPNAKAAYVQLANKFNEKAGDRIIPNTIMQQTILEDAAAYFGDDSLRNEMINKAQKGEGERYLNKIPREFWISGDANPYITDDEQDPTKPDGFKSKMEALFRKMNARYDTNLKPDVLFHKDLEQWLKAHAEDKQA